MAPYGPLFLTLKRGHTAVWPVSSGVSSIGPLGPRPPPVVREFLIFTRGEAVRVDVERMGTAFPVFLERRVKSIDFDDGSL